MSKPEKPPTNVYSKDELPERPSVEVKRFKTEDGFNALQNRQVSALQK